MNGQKEKPTQIKSTLKTKATKQLQLELDVELEEDLVELSVAELKKEGKLESNKRSGT